MVSFRCMTSAELAALFRSDAAFFEALPDLREAVLYGSALQEAEITSDADLLIVPSRELSGMEKVELRQQIWTRFKDRIPVMFEVACEEPGRSKADLAASGVPLETVYVRV